MDAARDAEHVLRRMRSKGVRDEVVGAAVQRQSIGRNDQVE
jgi:hypothetical protein